MRSNVLTRAAHTMKAELTAIIEPAPEGGYWAICPEVPGANGQGETVEEAKRNLIEAMEPSGDNTVRVMLACSAFRREFDRACASSTYQAAPEYIYLLPVSY